MTVTVKISDDANALLEVYLGVKRGQGANENGRLNKEDVVTEAVKQYVKNNLDPILLKSLTKSGK